MVTESIDSFVKKDLDSAAAVVKYDNVVDDLFLKVKTELPKLLQQDPQNAEYYIDLIMVASILSALETMRKILPSGWILHHSTHNE